MDHTQEPVDRQARPALAAALGYAARGWSIIPIRSGKKGEKKPALRSWKPYQTTPADEVTLRGWFAQGPKNLAVVLGPVSGGLVCRDFDRLDAYTAWAVAHPDLAATLPTVTTARGRHVYFTADWTTIKHFDDGELRGGGYCLLPPSIHPDGPRYNWQTPLPDGPIPRVDNLEAAGFLTVYREDGENRERRDAREHVEPREDIGHPGHRAHGEHGEHPGVPRTTETTQAMIAPWGSKGEAGNGRIESTPAPADNDQVDDGLSQLVLDHLPAAPGHRNAQVFELARALKAVAWLADMSGNDLDRLEPCVHLWHNEGVRRGVIATVPFTETWIDFLRAWSKVRFPKGEEPMVALFEKVAAGPLPDAANRYEEKSLRLLVALCCELQRTAGGEPFFLACRSAGRLLGVTHTQANRWLFLLTHDRIIEVVERGDRARRRASRYRYVADGQGCNS